MPETTTSAPDATTAAAGTVTLSIKFNGYKDLKDLLHTFPYADGMTAQNVLERAVPLPEGGIWFAIMTSLYPRLGTFDYMLYGVNGVLNVSPPWGWWDVAIQGRHITDVRETVQSGNLVECVYSWSTQDGNPQ